MRLLVLIWLAILQILTLSGCSRIVPPEKARVLVIGVDGATWGEIYPLIEKGDMPNLSALVARGSTGSLETLLPTISPVIWTTIATGVLPARHGIKDFFVPAGVPGEVLPVTGRSRKAYALWETLGAAGRSVAVIGWYATWPAEHVNGVFISDHEVLVGSWKDLVSDNLTATYFVRDDKGRILSSLSKRVVLDEGAMKRLETQGDVATPPWLERVVQKTYRRTSDLTPADLRRFGQIDSRELAKVLSEHKIRGHLLSVTASGYLTDMNRSKMALMIWHKENPDFLAVYLPGLDGVEHYGWKYHHPDGFLVLPDGVKRYGSFIPEYYRYVDELLGKLVAMTDERTIIIVLSDHGHRAWQPEIRYRSVGPTSMSGQHIDRPPGILVMAGGPIRQRHILSHPSVVDIAPTIHYLLGVPVARDLDGAVLKDAIKPGYLRLHPIPVVPTYNVRKTLKPLFSPQDAAYVEKLRALGYIK
jgi:hypothetical protein